MAGPLLVTGAAGFVGGHLLDLLTPHEPSVVAWFHPAAPPRRRVEGVEWHAVDLLDRHRVAREIDTVQPSAVYHLAGAAHVADSWHHTVETYEGNVLATHFLLDALAGLAPPPRVLITGSATVYRPQSRPIAEDDPLGPNSPYAVSKLAQEICGRRAWTDQGLPVVLARSFNHSGPRQEPAYVAPSVARQIALIDAGRQEPVLVMGNLDPKRDLTDVRDTVRAYQAMMRLARPGRPYNVCSGVGRSIGEIVEAFVSRAKRPVGIVQDPARLRPNDTPLLVGDHSRLTEETGWVPQIGFGQTVDDMLEYWRRRVADEAP
ncbi:MAG: GDP-mannose 4,6-dehydratase [Acidobacteriota bacterium]